MKISLETIAQACHHINRAFCLANGDDSQPRWNDAPDWQKASALNGVALHVTDPNMSPDASHNAWLAQKTREGWKYGKVKNVEAKEHPCFLPYDKLPPEQKAKDFLFTAVVSEFATLLGANARAEAAVMAADFHAAMENPQTAPAEASSEPAAGDPNAAQATVDETLGTVAEGGPTTASDGASSETQTSSSDATTPPSPAESATTDSAEKVAETQPVAETVAAE